MMVRAESAGGVRRRDEFDLDPTDNNERKRQYSIESYHFIGPSCFGVRRTKVIRFSSYTRLMQL